MNKKAPIGVFDSGIGGLTVFEKIRKLLPSENIIYFGDTARTPYGSRPESEVRAFVDEILNFMEYHQVKAAVAACNSITVLGLESLRKNRPFIMVGVSKGAKTALQASPNKRIGVLATAMTINSGAHARAIRAIDPSAGGLGIACPKFAPLIEAEHFEGITIENAVEEYLSPLKKIKVDSVILACTHYPFIAPVIQKYMGAEVTVIDPAMETAMELSRVLQENNMQNDIGNGYSRLCFSADLPRAERIAKRLLGDLDFETQLVDL